MKEKQRIENIMRNIVEVIISHSLLNFFNNLKNSHPKRLPIVPVAVKKTKSSKNPLLIRIDTNSGHGASNTKKNLESTADIYAFIWWNMGFVPKF